MRPQEKKKRRGKREIENELLTKEKENRERKEMRDG